MIFTKRKVYRVKVTTVDTELELTITENTIGLQLFTQVCETLSLREVWYFGLQYKDQENMQLWLDLNRKVSKQLRNNVDPILLSLKVKYFPEDVSTEIIFENTQKAFYLQVKESILSGEIYCPLETSLLLASYACQVKYGDYDSETMKQGFLKDEILLPENIQIGSEQTREQLEASMICWYKEHTGQMQSDAMLEYLRTAQELEMYGVTYFTIKNKRGTGLILGVDAFGLNIYPEHDKLTPKIGFPWSEVANVSFQKHKFIIRPVDKSGKKLVFYSAHVRQNQQILSICVGTHEMYMRRRKPEPVEVQHMRAQAKAEKTLKLQEREKIRRALHAQKQAEQQVQSLRANLATELTEQELIRRQAKELEIRVRELEKQLCKEAEMRQELELAEQRLRSKTEELQATCKWTEDEKLRLQSEKDTIQAEIQRLTRSMERRSIRIDSQRMELTRLVKNNTSTKGPWQLVQQREPEPIKSPFSAATNTLLPSDLNNGQKSRTLLSPSVLSTIPNVQTNRVPSYAADENPMNSREHDRFRSIRNIRHGNTRRKVDEFESM